MLVALFLWKSLHWWPGVYGAAVGFHLLLPYKIFCGWYGPSNSGNSPRHKLICGTRVFCVSSSIFASGSRLVGILSTHQKYHVKYYPSTYCGKNHGMYCDIKVVSNYV
jgi:hypothetical protein